MVYLFLANGFEEIEALCPLDLLRRAGVEVTVVGIGSDKIMGAHGITVSADVPEEFYRDANPEMIILPGGMPGTKNLDVSKPGKQVASLPLSSPSFPSIIGAAQIAAM